MYITSKKIHERKVDDINSKGHLYLSLAKSVIRIAGAAVGIGKNSVAWVAGSFLVAEILGVAEELVDERG